MSRRSRPPRKSPNRKGDSEAPRPDTIPTVRPPARSAEVTETRPPQGPPDELAVLDAAWDELLV
jgi:hypothetical protein